MTPKTVFYRHTHVVFFPFGDRLTADLTSQTKETVYLDDEIVEVTGTIDPGIVLTPSSAGYSPIE